jgi:hypothetical protein
MARRHSRRLAISFSNALSQAAAFSQTVSASFQPIHRPDYSQSIKASGLPLLTDDVPATQVAVADCDVAAAEVP